MKQPPRSDGYRPVEIEKRGSKKKTFLAKFEYGPNGYAVVAAELQCCYCYRTEVIDVSANFASKFPHGFDGTITQAKSYGWLINSSGNIEQKRFSGKGPIIMCPECRNPFEAQGRKLKKELEFMGDDVLALYLPHA